MTELFDLFEDIERHEAPVTREDVLKPPFSYPGAKTKSTGFIIPLLPCDNKSIYVEPFGGSAAVMLARRPVRLEVFNDRYAGVCDFYRCIRNPELMERLCIRIELTIHSREEFIWSRDTWKNADDPVERAARWYYMTMYSFSRLGRNFGRSTGVGARLPSITDRIPHFKQIHARLCNVQIENQDWRQCIKDYDSHDTVFYLDPPYLNTVAGCYTHGMNNDEHREFLDVVFACKGFCAVSGYSNPLYDEAPWDSRHQWNTKMTLKGYAYTESNAKQDLEHLEDNRETEECLWIKEVR